jgi:hypothetical protein
MLNSSIAIVILINDSNKSPPQIKVKTLKGFDIKLHLKKAFSGISIKK